MAKFTITGFADEISPDLGVQMDELAKLGVKYIEMRGVDGKNVSDLTLDEAKAVRARLDARGFRVSSIGSPVGKTKITDDFASALAQFEHTLELAKILGAPTIRIFSFFTPKGERPEDYRDEVIRRLKKYIELAEKTNIVLCHENERDIYGDNPARCLDLMRTLACDRFRFIFDPANFILLENEVVDCFTSFCELEQYVRYMHIKDGIHGQWVVPAGYGEGHVKAILQKLSDDGVSCFLSLEPHLGSFKGLEKFESSKKAAEMPDGGPKCYTAAYEALVKLLGEIGADYE